MLGIVVALAVSQAGGLGVRGEDGVQVHIESNNPGIQLFRHLGTSVGSFAAAGGGTGTLVVQRIANECSAPCDMFIPKPRDTFFLSGGGATTSDAFSLSGHGSSVTLKVAAGNAWMRTAGWGLTLVGASAVITAGITFAVSAALSGSTGGAANPYGSVNNGMQTLSLLSALGGGAALAGGIPMIAFSGTSVEFLPGARAPARAKVPGKTEL
jgi:hypothetical protein